MYSTIQGKTLYNHVNSGQAAGTFRKSMLVKRLSDDVLGYKVFSGDKSEDLGYAGIIWCPGKSAGTVLSTATKFVMGYYTPHI